MKCEYRPSYVHTTRLCNTRQHCMGKSFPLLSQTTETIPVFPSLTAYSLLAFFVPPLHCKPPPPSKRSSSSWRAPRFPAKAKQSQLLQSVSWARICSSSSTSSEQGGLMQFCFLWLGAEVWWEIVRHTNTSSFVSHFLACSFLVRFIRFTVSFRREEVQSSIIIIIPRIIHHVKLHRNSFSGSPLKPPAFSVLLRKVPLPFTSKSF